MGLTRSFKDQHDATAPCRTRITICPCNAWQLKRPACRRGRARGAGGCGTEGAISKIEEFYRRWQNLPIVLIVGLEIDPMRSSASPGLTLLNADLGNGELTSLASWARISHRRADPRQRPIRSSICKATGCCRASSMRMTTCNSIV